MTGPDVVMVDGLSKHYGDRRVVQGVSFSLERGETVALLGHNGAGKTTTVEMIEGLRRRNGGATMTRHRKPG